MESKISPFLASDTTFSTNTVFQPFDKLDNACFKTWTFLENLLYIQSI